MIELVLGVAGGISLGGVCLWWLSLRPSHHRRWSKDQVTLPEPQVKGTHVFIKNIRNFTYQTESDYTPGYYDKTFDITKLRKVYFFFVPFSRTSWAAHAFFSFEFVGPDWLAVSVELRKKHHEKYSIIKGLMKQNELMYVIADEKDVLRLRTHCRHNDVYMYPLQLDERARQSLFLDVMRRAEKLVQQPEFYHTIWNACVTNLVRHINSVVPEPIPFDPRLVMSGYADRYLHAHGLFDTTLPFKQARQAFYISPRARQCDDEERFSRDIRVSD